MENDLEAGALPKSDTPVRLLVVFATALANAPLIIFVLVLVSGHEFSSPAYNDAYGWSALSGLILLLLLTVILAVAGSPTWWFAGKCLLATFAVFFISILIALPSVV